MNDGFKFFLGLIAALWLIIGSLFAFGWLLHRATDDGETCHNETNTVLSNQLYTQCLDKLAVMRSSGGGNYTTNDDEDLDEAIRMCSATAWSQATRTVCTKDK